MAKYKGNQLSVAIASSVLACVAILTQFASEAQAAVLTRILRWMLQAYSAAGLVLILLITMVISALITHL